MSPTPSPYWLAQMLDFVHTVWAVAMFATVSLRTSIA